MSPPEDAPAACPSLGPLCHSPTLRARAFEKFDEQVIRAGDHHVPELRFRPDVIPEMESALAYVLDQRVEIIGLDAQVVDCSSARSLGRLVIEVDESTTEAQTHAPHAGDLLVP